GLNGERGLQAAKHLEPHGQSPSENIARPARERKLSLAISDPIDMENNVPALLLHDGIEERDQARREEARVAGNRENPKSEEGIKALAVTYAQEFPIWIIRRQGIRSLFQLDAV